MIGAQIVMALQTIPSRNIDPVDSAVISIGFMRGGSAYNVIPDELHIGGTVRSFRPEVRDLFERRMGEIARGTAALHGAEAELDYRRGYPPTINHADEASFAADVAAEICGEEHVDRNIAPSLGGEDFSYMLQAGPGAMLWIGNGPGEGGCILHNTRYDFNDGALPIGVSFFARLAERFLARQDQACDHSASAAFAISAADYACTSPGLDGTVNRGDPMRVHVVNVPRPDPAMAGQRSTASPIWRGRSRRRAFAGLWVTDSFGRGRPTLDPVVLMSVIAAVTNRIEIGTCVLQVPVRHPVELAHRIQSLARDDRRPAEARSRQRLDPGRFRPRRRRLHAALQVADAGARNDAPGLARRAAGGRHADPVARHRGRAGAPARRLAQQALDRLCRRAMRRLDRLRALPEAGGARSRHQILPRRRRQARRPVERHHRPARQRRGHAAGRQGARSC